MPGALGATPGRGRATRETRRTGSRARTSWGRAARWSWSLLPHDCFEPLRRVDRGLVDHVHHDAVQLPREAERCLVPLADRGPELVAAAQPRARPVEAHRGEARDRALADRTTVAQQRAHPGGIAGLGEPVLEQMAARTEDELGVDHVPFLAVEVVHVAQASV